MPGSTAILDGFTRANATTLGANWALLTNFNFGGSDLGVLSNQAYNPTGGTYIVMYWSAATFGPDCEVYLTLSTVSSDNIALYARTQQPGYNTFDGYMLNVDRTTGEFSIRRVDNGTETVLGAAVSQAVANGNKILLECIGSTITAYINTSGTWVSVLSRTDATYNAAGGIAFYGGGNATTWRYDDFGGGTISSGSSYTESGSATSASSASGADALTLAETGSARGVASSSGSDLLTLPDSGGATGAAGATGADSAAMGDTGAAVSTASATGADTLTTTESGSATTTASATGAAALSAFDSGSAVSAASASGADSFSGATFYTESGGATAGASASGADSQVWIDAGSALGIGMGSAADAIVMTDAGGGVLIATAAGVDAFGVVGTLIPHALHGASRTRALFGATRATRGTATRTRALHGDDNGA